MGEDRLLAALARLAREEEERERQRFDERWEALTAGTLPAADEEILRSLAGESSEAAAAYEAFRPLDADFRARVAARLKAEVEAGAAAPRESSPRLLPFRRRRRLWWAAPAVAAAAAVIFLLLRPAAPPPLPSYDLTLSGTVRPLRSPGAVPEATVRVVAVGNRLQLLLTPSTAVTAPVAVRVFLSRPGELSVLEAPPAEISAAGAVRLAGEVGRDIPLPAGETSLLVAVSRPGSLPSGEELRARLGELTEVQTPAWQGWRVALRVE